MAIIEIPHNTVVKVGSSVLKLGLTIMEGNKQYFRVPVFAGAPAPLLPILPDNPRYPITSPWLEIPEYNSEFVPKASSDLYIYCTGGTPGLSGYMEVL